MKLEYLNLVNKNNTEELRKNVGLSENDVTIYRIRNTITNEDYIGQTSNYQNRKTIHIYKLKNGIHHNSLLQKSFDTYGLDAFIFEVVMPTSHDVADFIETFYINKSKKSFNLYSGGKKGFKVPQSTKDKISAKTRSKYNITTTGITRQKDKRTKQGYYYVYQYLEDGKPKRFGSSSLSGLQKKAESKGFDLDIFDKEVVE